MDVIIVCHTEFGFVHDKGIIFDKKATDGVKGGVLNLIKLSKKYGAKLTFAICPEVADYIPLKISQEIGLHLHPGWQEFEEAGFKYNYAEVTMVPQNTVLLTGKEAEQMLKLMEGLEDSDDVQKVYANFGIADEEMERLSA